MRKGHDVHVIQSVAQVDFEPQVLGLLDAVEDFFQFLLPFFKIRGVGIMPGMDFNELTARGLGGLDLFRVRVDEKAGLDFGFVDRGQEIMKLLFPSGNA